MKRNTVFFANFKHIGPIQIITDGQNATVVSVLGIKRFNFSKLPQNRNNKYSILKLSMKTYMNSIIDGFDGIVDQPRHKNGILGFIKNLITPLTLESGNHIEKLKGLIIKDYRDFSDDNVKNFMEIDCSENILEVFHVPVLVFFEHFEESLFLNQDSLSVSNKEISSMKIIKKNFSNEEREYVLRSFVTSEVKFYLEIKDFFKDIHEHTGKFNSVLQVVTYYKNIVEKLAEKFFIGCDEKFIQNLQNGDKCLQIWNENEINSKEIASTYLSIMDMIDSHLDFISEYEILENTMDQEIREKITTILSKTTNYSKIFTQLCEVDDSWEMRKASILFYKANKFLNLHSEKMHLKLMDDYLKINNIHLNGSLVAVLDCKLSGDCCMMYLTNESLFVADSRNKSILLCKLENIDIILYNKIIYIVSKYTELLNVPFLVISHTNNVLITFESVNKETTNEFCEKVYTTKYNCPKTDEFYYYYKRHDSLFIDDESKTSEKTEPYQKLEYRDTPNTYLFDNNNQILVSKLDNFDKEDADFTEDSVLTVKIEDMYFRTGGIIQLNEKELFERIKEEVNMKRISTLNLQNTLYTITSIISNIDQSRLKQFHLDLYPEDEVTLMKKKELFIMLYQSILELGDTDSKSIKNYTPDVLVDFTKHLYSDDILQRYEDNVKDYFVRRYLNIFYSGCDRISNKFDSIEEAVILFAMLIQRNLYYFLDVNDIEKLNRDFLISGYSDGKKNLRPYTFENSTKIIQVIEHLRKMMRHDLIDLIVDALF